MRLDTLFKMEYTDVGTFARETGGHNPKEVLKQQLDSEVAGRKFRFRGVKEIEKAVVGGEKKGAKKQDKQAGKGGKDQNWD
jgi:hypothetical protein